MLRRGDNGLAKSQGEWAAHCRCPQHPSFPGRALHLCHTPLNFSLWWSQHPYSTASLWSLAKALCWPMKCEQMWCLPFVGCHRPSHSAKG